MQAIAGEVTALVTGKRLIELPEGEKFCPAIGIEELCGIIADMVVASSMNLN
jgi:hypothetical protein